MVLLTEGFKLEQKVLPLGSSSADTTAIETYSDSRDFVLLESAAIWVAA